MSKFTQVASTGLTLSIAAGEEASRIGDGKVDVEHVFLALVISEGRAGRALRDLGITLDGARTAVTDMHRDQLASLGITAEIPSEGRIRFLEQGGRDWNERALKLLTEAGGPRKAGDTAAVLQETLSEPSGVVEDILARLGTTPEEVRARLDATTPAVENGGAANDDGEPGAHGQRTRRLMGSHTLARSLTVFVPAAPDDVWALVSDAMRIPEWDLGIGTITPEGSVWEGRARTVAHDGRRLKVKPALRRQMIERIAADARHHVEWLMSYPDAPRGNRRSIIVDIAPATGGSDVTVRFAWVKGSGPTGFRKLVAPLTRLLARPFVRFVVWTQALSLTGGISRALR